MNLEELMQKYQQLSTKPLGAPSLENESGESVEALYHSSSLRILLLRTAEEPDHDTIEVEVWLPGPYSDGDSNSSSQSDETVKTGDLGEALSKMINHLQYLHRLHQSGFMLDVIKHDCLWTASRTFSEPPSRELFEVLLPP
jgi:hypothetical protein